MFSPWLLDLPAAFDITCPCPRSFSIDFCASPGFSSGFSIYCAFLFSLRFARSLIHPSSGCLQSTCLCQTQLECAAEEAWCLCVCVWGGILPAQSSHCSGGGIDNRTVDTSPRRSDDHVGGESSSGGVPCYLFFPEACGTPPHPQDSP